MPIASAMSVPGFGLTHLLACIALGVNSGEMAMTSVPLYLASQKKWASGMRVTAGLQNHTRQQRDL